MSQGKPDGAGAGDVLDVAEMAEHEREFRRSSRDDDEESLDDENDYVDEQARINAEKNVFVCANEDGCSSWQNEF